MLLKLRYNVPLSNFAFKFNLRRYNEGPIATVYFTNGDVKRTHPGGRVEYFYREVDTWHTTHAGGAEVYHFPSGQTEAHGRGLHSSTSLLNLSRFCH